MVLNWLHHAVIYVRRYANRLIHIPLPTLVTGAKHVDDVAELLTQHEKKRVFVVTDKMLKTLGLIEPLLTSLDAHHIDVILFDEVTPDPTTDLIGKGVDLYTTNQCEAVVAFGGGSVIDCTKAIAASVIKQKPIMKLAGLFRVRTKLPYFIAVPTTAGTGSEATVVAVVTDPVNKQKFTVIDPCLVPDVALLDPVLMKRLPPNVTAETGIDALTHAIESYIGRHAYPLTKQYALAAMKRIFDYLPVAYAEGDNIEARAEMALASFYAGAAFTRTSVGYVHAIAHQLGGYYHIPHGLANAVLLPHILKFSKQHAQRRLAQLAYQLNMVDSHETEVQAAEVFVQRVSALLKTVGIQEQFDVIDKNDIPLLANRAIKEAFCDYPVPRLMTIDQCQQILTDISSS